MFDHLRIPLKEIESATNNFDDGSFIGEGGFGRVYKGELSHNNDRSIVAIKRLNCDGYQGEKEFVTEITMLSGYKHKNLASLLGFCDEGGEMILVYKYEAHGSLDKYLRNTNDGYNLTWIQRLNICIGAAHGLEYLHNGVGLQLRVIHRDIKSSNILLDENWKAKIADFGLSKFSPANQKNTFLFTNPVGTIAYCDPQYWNSNILTKESDVYSFGVVLFEVLCGRLAYHDTGLLAPVARDHYERKNLDEIIDRNIRDQIDADSLKVFSEIAYQCLQEYRKNRPTMTRVVRALEKALEFQLPNKRLQPSTSVHPDHLYSFARGAQSIGICYGMLGNNLPSATQVIILCKSNNIQQMRIYDPNQPVLQALRGSGIQLILGVANSDLQYVAATRDNAQQWVQNNIVNYWPDVSFRYIAVGNQVAPSSSLAQYVHPAMTNVHEAVAYFGLEDQIKVSTSVDMGLLGVSYPPSQGAFSADALAYLYPIIGFLININAPLLANIYTYFSYVDNPSDISLPYALFTSPNVVVWDQGRGYQNLFDAMLDSLYSALERSGGASIQVVISESGWPSYGAFAATYDNACAYYTNLVQHVKGGTPKRSGAIETYLFAMFDENNKSPELEKHFGVFYPNQQPKFQINFASARLPDVLPESDIASELLKSNNASVPLKSDV